MPSDERVFLAAHLAFEIARRIEAGRRMVAERVSDEQELDHQRSVAITMAYVMEFLNQVFDANRNIAGLYRSGAIFFRHEPTRYLLDLSPLPHMLANAPANSPLMVEIYAKLSAIVKENDGGISVRGVQRSVAVASQVSDGWGEMLRFS